MRILFALLLLSACALCGAAAPGYPAVTPGRALVFPADFGAHPDYRTEWWYVTGWLKPKDGGKPLGFQVTFFRNRPEVDQSNPSAFAPRQLIIGHAALSDPSVGRLVHDQRSAREGFGLAYARTGNTDIRLGDWNMVRLADGSYRIGVRARELSFDLVLAPTQPPLVQGEHGYSRKGPRPENASYYYSQPQLAARGTVARAGTHPVEVSGDAWLDHEWSTSALMPHAAGWDWIGANLDDGAALMAFQIRSKQGGKLWAHAAVRDASGKVSQYATDEVSFAPQARWKSPRTDAVYPVATTITTGTTHWQIQPLQQDQELDARRSTGAVYWEGAVRVARDGVAAGHGYLELTGYFDPMNL